MEIVDLVILRIRNLRSVNNSLKWSDLGLVTEQVDFDLFRHQSVMEQLENDLFHHLQDHFQKYDYAFGFLFAISNLPPLILTCGSTLRYVFEKNIEYCSESG